MEEHKPVVNKTLGTYPRVDIKGSETRIIRNDQEAEESKLAGFVPSDITITLGGGSGQLPIEHKK